MNREDTNDSDTAGESFDPSPPTYMLRHGATLLGRSKDRKAQGDSTADRLGAIHDGLFTDKQVFTTVGPLEAEDGGTHGVNRRRRSRRGVGNRGQIADGGHDGIEGESKERKCKQGQPESFVDIHHLMARAKLFFLRSIRRVRIAVLASLQCTSTISLFLMGLMIHHPQKATTHRHQPKNEESFQPQRKLPTQYIS